MTIKIVHFKCCFADRVDSSVLDQENSESTGSRESEFKGSDRLGASDGTVKKSKHLEVDVLGNEKELYPVDQAQIKKHGKPPSYLMVKISFFSFSPRERQDPN